MLGLARLPFTLYTLGFQKKTHLGTLIVIFPSKQCDSKVSMVKGWNEIGLDVNIPCKNVSGQVHIA